MNKNLEILYEFDYEIKKTIFDEQDYKEYKKSLNEGIKDKKKRKKLIHKEKSKIIELVLVKITN